MTKKMKTFELRMCPNVVDQLRVLALRLAYERGREESWSSLVREGADLILKAHASPAVSTPPEVAVAGGAR